MHNHSLKAIYQKYSRQFRRHKIPIEKKDLQRIVEQEAKKAEINYSRLPRPRTCSLETYVRLWVRIVLDQKFTLKTLRKVDLAKPGKDPYARALKSFFYHLPLELIPVLSKKLFNAPFSQRKKIWKEFDLPSQKLNRALKRLASARNKIATDLGYIPFLEFFLEKNKIPSEDYLLFIKNVDAWIRDLNQQLPRIKDLPSWFYSEFNLPCFLCKLSHFPFCSLKEVFDFVARKYPVLEKFKKKIKIRIQGTRGFTIYHKEQDYFEIIIEKEVNIRHQSLTLIHELGHVISLLKNFAQGVDIIFSQGKYGAEKEATKIEDDLLQKISNGVYRANIGEILLFPLRNTLFELEFYRNPNQDLGRLYAATFNRCFKGAKQKSNPLYLLDQNIVFNPFRSLPHIVGCYNLDNEP